MRIDAVSNVRAPGRPERIDQGERSARHSFREHLDQEEGIDEDELPISTEGASEVLAQLQMQVPPGTGPIRVPIDPAITEVPVAPLAPAISSALAVVSAAPMTPLEQAVHELLRELDEPEQLPEGELEAPAPVLGPTIVPAEAPEAPAQVAAAARPINEPQSAPMPSSHVHLVLDDQAGERVVLTVAVRGSDVHVNLRASDDAAASLARNAATLDHALRLRGLDLAELDVQREPSREQRQPERERARDDQPTFNLEEVA